MNGQQRDMSSSSESEEGVWGREMKEVGGEGGHWTTCLWLADGRKARPHGLLRARALLGLPCGTWPPPVPYCSSSSRTYIPSLFSLFV